MPPEDAAGNGNFGSSSSVDKTVTVDKKNPTPTIDAVSGTKNNAFPITINFDEDVRNFDSMSDISVSTQSGNATGTASSINKVNAAQYTATITPSGMGTLRISVSAGAAEDTAGNESVASMNVDVSVDTSGPTPTITAPTDTQNGAFDVTIDFGESVTGFVKSEITCRRCDEGLQTGNPVRREWCYPIHSRRRLQLREYRHGDDRCGCGCCPRWW